MDYIAVSEKDFRASLRRIAGHRSPPPGDESDLNPGQFGVLDRSVGQQDLPDSRISEPDSFGWARRTSCTLPHSVRAFRAVACML